jgi:hypothetical protein
VAKTNTAIAVSSAIKEVIQKQALATRLTQKEVVYLILHMGVQKPGFYEKRRCNQQIRKKTRFRGVGVRKSPI